MIRMNMSSWTFLGEAMKMIDACCMWCANARQSQSACGIKCGVNGFIHPDGQCPDYEKISEADLAEEELSDCDGELTDMANGIKWILREIGGKWPLLGAALIDRLQDVAEKTEMWGDAE